MNGCLLEANEVCALVGCSVYTLNLWYRFKRSNPDNKYSQMLPDIIYLQGDRKRYWNQNDVWMLIEFKTSIPQGRSGILGSETQKYIKKKGAKKNGKKKVGTRRKD